MRDSTLPTILESLSLLMKGEGFIIDNVKEMFPISNQTRLLSWSGTSSGKNNH